MGNMSDTDCSADHCPRKLKGSSSRRSCSEKSGSRIRKISLNFDPKTCGCTLKDDVCSNDDTKSISEAKMNVIIKGNIERQMKKFASPCSYRSQARTPSEWELESLVQDKIRKARCMSRASCASSPSSPRSCSISRRHSFTRVDTDNGFNKQSACCGRSSKPKLWKSVLQSKASDRLLIFSSNYDKSDLETDYDDRSVVSFSSRFSQRQNQTCGCPGKASCSKLDCLSANSNSKAILENKRKRLRCVSDNLIKKRLRDEAIKDSYCMKPHSSSCVEGDPCSLSGCRRSETNSNKCRRKRFTSSISSEPCCSSKFYSRNNSFGHTTQSVDRISKGCDACDKLKDKPCSCHASASKTVTTSCYAEPSNVNMKFTSRPTSLTKINSQNSRCERTPAPRLKSDTSLTRNSSHHEDNRAPSYSASRCTAATAENSLNSNIDDVFIDHEMDSYESRYLSPNRYKKPKSFISLEKNAPKIFNDYDNVDDFSNCLSNNSATSQHLSHKWETEKSCESPSLFEDELRGHIETNDICKVSKQGMIQPSTTFGNQPGSLNVSNVWKESLPSKVYVFRPGCEDEDDLADIESDINNIFSAFGSKASAKSFTVQCNEDMGNKISRDKSANDAVSSQTGDLTSENEDINLTSTHRDVLDTIRKLSDSTPPHGTYDINYLKNLVQTADSVPVNKESSLQEHEK